ncbi:MAG: glycosyltransferase [Prevotella sp.]|jgi:glycosyltransferase involved in cell wall biosynthesis|nr:glycosyltransferase [Prevotella sp.]MCH3991930.1 glycosyltransferase [Prevotella sp.]MCH4017502.1 glycosyltransferase [Prevotella sp.]MCH4185255.1 glycosyltransferase [Prevotella sp.]MCH4215261.1 glycosyltransferase [Prevotella sp.]
MPVKSINTPDSVPPLVSFIITTHDVPDEMLKECLQQISTLSLNPNEREIILIDNGSKRSPSRELFDVDENTIYVRKKDMGLSQARNIGIQLATGNYIQFLNGSSYLITAPYEHCLDIVRFHNPDLVFFQETEKKKPGTSFTFIGPVTGSSYLHDHPLKASVCGYIFKQQILGSLRFSTKILHEDEDFTPQLCLRGERIYYTDAEACFNRQQRDGAAYEQNKRYHLTRLTDIERVIAHLQDLSDQLPEADRVALHRRVAQLSMDYLYQTIQVTRSSRHLNNAIEWLRKRGLFPLPDKNYSYKYCLFRKAINTKAGRKLLLLLPR